MEVGFGFSLGRSEGYPSRYGDQHTPCVGDVLVVGILTGFVILGVALFAIIPAYNSFMRKFVFCRILCSIIIGGIILCGNFGHSWEQGVIRMSAPYKPGAPDEVKGEIGLYIALRGINITLRGEPVIHDDQGSDKRDRYNKPPDSPLAGERINYNEHFSWEWAQGRFGFGKYAGRFARDFRAAVLRGLPLPILQIAEYFTFDGEGIRFGRHYRLAGWYSHLILWFAFGTWLISNILFCLVIRTAAFFLFLTGALQLAAIGVWTFVRNFVELQIPFQTEDQREDIIMSTKFGPDYYIVLANGFFCVILSGVIAMLDEFKPDEMCQMFGIDPLTIYDELLLSKEEIKEEKRRQTILHGKKTGDIEMRMGGISTSPSGDVGSYTGNSDKGEIFLRKKSNKTSFLVRQSLRQIKPRIPRRSKEQPKHLSPADQHVRQPLLYTSDNEGNSGINYGASSSKSGPQSSLKREPPPLPAFKPQTPI